MEKGKSTPKYFGKLWVNINDMIILIEQKMHKLFNTILLGKLCLRESLLQQNACESFQKGKKFSFPISTVAVSNKGLEFIK